MSLLRVKIFPKPRLGNPAPNRFTKNFKTIPFWLGRSPRLGGDHLWERVRASPNPYNELAAVTWCFEQVEGRHRARMFVDQPVADLRNETLWPDIYRWISEKLSLVYERVVPKLREEMDLAEGK